MQVCSLINRSLTLFYVASWKWCASFERFVTSYHILSLRFDSFLTSFVDHKLFVESFILLVSWNPWPPVKSDNTKLGWVNYQKNKETVGDSPYFITNKSRVLGYYTLGLCAALCNAGILRMKCSIIIIIYRPIDYNDLSVLRQLIFLNQRPRMNPYSLAEEKKSF